MAGPAGESDASHSGAGPDTGPAGRRGGPGPANSADTAGRRRGGSRAGPDGRRGASNSDRPDRRGGRGRRLADSRGGRSARTGASPQDLAGDPQGSGHARGLVRLMAAGRAGSRPRGFARGPGGVEPSGPSPSRCPGRNPSILPQPAEATGFVPPCRLLSRIPHFSEINDSSGRVRPSRPSARRWNGCSPTGRRGGACPRF